MTLTRTTSMPEAPTFLPMKLRDTTDLNTLQEHGEAGKMEKQNSEGTQEMVDGDYGFYPMDDSSSDSSANPAEPSPPTGSTRKKPSLRRGSAYGNDAIPLDFEQRKFNRVLPKPDLTKRASAPSAEAIHRKSSGLFRVASEPVFVRPIYQEEHIVSNDEPKQAPADEQGSKEDKRVSYGKIQIREHSQTLGDNPSCSYGTPVQLDWLSEDLEALDVSLYEEYKPEPRNKRNMQLNSFQRMDVLKSNGHSQTEIKESKKEVDKVRKQREITKFIVTQYPQVMYVNDALESGLRKLKRTVSKSKVTSEEVSYTPTKSKDDISVCATPKERLLEMMDNDISHATAAF